MNHSILKLDKTRQYLLVEHSTYENIQISEGEWEVKSTGKEETWYDTNSKFVEEKIVKVGDVYLNGRVTKILTYDKYVKEYPDTLATYDEVSASTDHKGYIRKVHDTKMQGKGFDVWYVPEVKYSINMKRSELAILVKEDLN